MTAWNSEQQRMLRAMGYDLLVPAPVSAPAALPGVVPAQTPTTNASPLLRSIQHAASGHDVSALITDLAALRGSPRAKRELWPKLRALRRPH